VQNLRNLFSAQQPPPVIGQVDPVIRQAIDLTSVQLQKNHVQLLIHLAAPAPVVMNSHDLQMVLLNLINNACEALNNTPHACIEISSWQTDAQTCIQVADNGPGIAPEEQAQIFNLLKTTKAQGSGIGLWLSRHLIERQGGHLTLEAGTLGARFLVSLRRS
jgi:C4-dicarboxylate-specific signal transduction histidine kinase